MDTDLAASCRNQVKVKYCYSCMFWLIRLYNASSHRQLMSDTKYISLYINARWMPMVEHGYDVVLVGGCGHVGLPLGVALASTGLKVGLYDISSSAVSQVNQGVAPFFEPGLEPLLKECIDSSLLIASTERTIVETAESIIVIIGTPVDEHQNPEPHKVLEAVRELLPHLTNDQQLILRSTVYPGTTKLIEQMIESSGLNLQVSFCPERIAEGHAMVELFELPQLVASRSEEGFARCSALFEKLTKKIVRMTPEEAELAKLFTNAWRYIKFAAANQLFMLAENFGLNYENIREGLQEDYPRAKDLPRSGFAAGPCLLKDTLQLAAFNNNDFVLGHAAINVNEGMPLYVVSKLETTYKIQEMTVGILGMAFKAESDDIRSSLAYKLKRILRYKAKNVLTSDPYVQNDPDLVTVEELLGRSDLIIIGAPHSEYATLFVDVPLVDIWGFRGGSSGL